MSAAALLRACLDDGLTLARDPTGAIKVRGPAEARARHLPAIKTHKAVLLTLLAEPRSAWYIREPDDTAWRSCFTPPLTLAEVEALYPGAQVEPVEEPADPLPALYRSWLGDIAEPRAVVTLTDAQAAEAVAAGVVTPETAAASVLVAIRSPLGAVGLMAVPKDRYDGFELLRALEAAPGVH
jgi:hypothetical protein